jgi:hypothetical protein
VRLAALLLFLGLSVHARNTWNTHGHDYVFPQNGTHSPDSAFFPVIWDVRTANGLLSHWEEHYHPPFGNPIGRIFQEAAQSGFNAVIIRSELGDKWFPEIPGSEGDKFYPVAQMARENGLHVIPGGLITELGQDDHNREVLDYLSLYIPMTSGRYPGQVIALFAFDEPDVKYLEDPSHSEHWLQYTTYWSDRVRHELGLPVLSYFAKFGSANSEGYIEAYTDTTCVLNRFARYADMVGINMYPAVSNFRRTDLLSPPTGTGLFTAASDFIQADPLHHQALNCRDEVIRVFPQGDSAVVMIDAISWDGKDLELEPAWSSALPFIPDGFASSDFRSGYAVHEKPGYVNSGAVFWHSDLPVKDAMVLSTIDGHPHLESLPWFNGADGMRPLFFSVGQTDFWADLTNMGGIIGRGRLAVLCGMEDSSGHRWMMLFAAEPSHGAALVPVFDSPRRLHFAAEGAVWGTFWGTWYEFGTQQSVARNGFVIHDAEGNYISLSQLARNYWQAYPAHGMSQYSELFGSAGMPDFMQVSRVDGDYPPFFAGRDLLTGFFREGNLIVAARSHFIGGSLAIRDSISVLGLNGEVTGFGLYRNDYRYSDRPLFTLSGGDVLKGTGSMETGASSGFIDLETVRYCRGDTVLAGIRAMHTRDAIRSLLVYGEDGFYGPECELYDDIFDHWRYQWYPMAHRTGMEIGIQKTERKNSMLAVVQAYGRSAFALPSYCPSPDTTLYMLTAPIVEGARGLVFYALDLAMMSGNGGIDGYSRAPFVLQNWGPSKDTENADVIGRMHYAVKQLTGRNSGGTDYLRILVDPSWTPLDDHQAANCHCSEDYLNFIALSSSNRDSLVVLAVNTSTEQLSCSPGIYLENLGAGFEITAHEGWLPTLIPVLMTPDGSSMALIDYTSIPPLTASLLTITSKESSEGLETGLRSATHSSGQTVLTFSVEVNTRGELLLFDLAGRRTGTLWSGEGTGSTVTVRVDRGDYPAGLYMALLRTDSGLKSAKCHLW